MLLQRESGILSIITTTWLCDCGRLWNIFSVFLRTILFRELVFQLNHAPMAIDESGTVFAVKNQLQRLRKEPTELAT